MSVVNSSSSRGDEQPVTAVLGEFNSYSISAAQTVPVYLPVRYLTLTRSFSRNFSHFA